MRGFRELNMKLHIAQTHRANEWVWSLRVASKDKALFPSTLPSHSPFQHYSSEFCWVNTTSYKSTFLDRLKCACHFRSELLLAHRMKATWEIQFSLKIRQRTKISGLNSNTEPEPKICFASVFSLVHPFFAGPWLVSIPRDTLGGFGILFFYISLVYLSSQVFKDLGCWDLDILHAKEKGTIEGS